MHTPVSCDPGLLDGQASFAVASGEAETNVQGSKPKMGRRSVNAAARAVLRHRGARRSRARDKAAALDRYDLDTAQLWAHIWPDTKNRSGIFRDSKIVSGQIQKTRSAKLRQSCGKAAHDMRSRTQRVTPRHAVCAARYPRYVRVMCASRCATRRASRAACSRHVRVCCACTTATP